MPTIPRCTLPEMPRPNPSTCINRERHLCHHSTAPPSFPNLAVAPLRSPSAAIRQREGVRRRPVVVTPAILQRLSDLSLAQAAQALGVSATAFNRACRRLGLRRWAYRRGPARPKPPTAGGGSSGSDSDG